MPPTTKKIAPPPPVVHLPAEPEPAQESPHPPDPKDPYAGLWIMSRAARLKEYQDDVELLNDLINTETSGIKATDLMMKKTVALKAAADETEREVGRTGVDEVPVVYELIGMDVKLLR